MINYPQEPPKITYYARVRSNLTGQLITNWQFFDSSIWYYGKCNSLQGGESEYIIEFDIWNNEPGFNAGMYDVHNKNAISCQLSLEPLNNESGNMELFKLNTPFLYGRCYSNNYREEWEPILMNKPLVKIYGNVSSKSNGILYNADHTILQTKIIMPINSVLQNNVRYPFNLTFSYSYE